MARFARMEVLNRMIEIGVVPVFYHDEVEVAKQIVSACSAGGARVVEFTNRGDLAFQVFGELVRHFAKADPSVILGVGSVIDAPTAALHIAGGANFAAGPILNPEVAKLCNRRKVAYSPGCGSASEISESSGGGDPPMGNREWAILYSPFPTPYSLPLTTRVLPAPPACLPRSAGQRGRP